MAPQDQEPDKPSTPPPHLRPPDIRRDVQSIRRSLTVLAVLAVAAALYLARDIVLPVMLAILLTLALRPLSRALGRIGVPSIIGAGLIVLTLFAGLNASVYVAAEPAGQWLEEAPEIGRQLQFKFRRLIRSASAIGDVGEQVEKMAQGNDAAREVVVRQPGLLTRAATGGAGVIAAGVLTLALLYFMLATGDLFMEKTIRVLPRLRDKVRALSIARTVEAEISRYLFTVTAINICLGAAIAAGMALVGLPNPVLWGVMGALLNFIPYIGSLIGVAVVFAVAVVTFNAPLDILAPPLIYFGLTALEGQFLTPTVIGRRLEMNPVAIFLGVAFWAWLWGVAGAVLAVPILLVIKITADHVDNLAPLSEFLSDRRGIGARDRQAARDQS